MNTERRREDVSAREGKRFVVRKVALFGWCVLDSSLGDPRRYPVRVFGYGPDARGDAERSVCAFCAADEACALHQVTA
jgi:hypothetical protein